MTSAERLNNQSGGFAVSEDQGYNRATIANDADRKRTEGKTLRLERASDSQNNRSVYGGGGGGEASAPYRECLWLFFCSP